MGSMKKGGLINSQYFVQSLFSINLFLKNFGLKYYVLQKIETRVESLLVLGVLEISPSQWVSFIKYLYLIVPNSKALKKKRLLNIYYLDLISSYRGWRHSKGLPVRGQRT